MANKLSTDKVNELWLAWQERQGIRYVAQKCHVAKKTVERYRFKEKWDERLAKIKQLASEKADMKQAEQNAKFIRIAESTINLYSQSLTKCVLHTCPKFGLQEDPCRRTRHSTAADEHAEVPVQADAPELPKGGFL